MWSSWFKITPFSSKKNRDTYVKEMVGESPNDRNDRGTVPNNSVSLLYLIFCTTRSTFVYSFLLIGHSYSAIRVATRWYQSHLGENVKVLLITNDRDNKRKAIEEGINAETGEIMDVTKMLAGSFQILDTLFFLVITTQYFWFQWNHMYDLLHSLVCST